MSNTLTRGVRVQVQPRYVADAVLGAIDGCVTTTFAVVAGAVGAGFSASVALIMGFANLLAEDDMSWLPCNPLSAAEVEARQADRARYADLLQEAQDDIQSLYSALS
mgnify:CR=1 FL=1